MPNNASRTQFWSWIRNHAGGDELRIDGEIADQSWWGDEVTPAIFRQQLDEHNGAAITVGINSPGGDVFAASAIYTALKEYKGKVTIRIDGLAASAASVIAMSGDEILMSPTATMMIHNPWSIAMGDARAMESMAGELREIAEGIVNAYQLRTKLPREQIRQMMDDETYMSADMAVELGFADKVLYQGNKPDNKSAYLYTKRAIYALANKPLRNSEEEEERRRLIDACHQIANKAMGRK